MDPFSTPMFNTWGQSLQSTIPMFWSTVAYPMMSMPSHRPTKNLLPKHRLSSPAVVWAQQWTTAHVMHAQKPFPVLFHPTSAQSKKYGNGTRKRIVPARMLCSIWGIYPLSQQRLPIRVEAHLHFPSHKMKVPSSVFPVCHESSKNYSFKR